MLVPAASRKQLWVRLPCRSRLSMRCRPRVMPDGIAYPAQYKTDQYERRDKDDDGRCKGDQRGRKDQYDKEQKDLHNHPPRGKHVSLNLTGSYDYPPA